MGSTFIYLVKINPKAMWTKYLIGVFLGFMHVLSGSSDTRPCLAPDPYPQYIVYPQNIPTSCSMFSKNPGVNLFTNRLKQLIYTSSILSDVFDFSQATPLQYSKFIYEVNIKFYTEKGFKNAAAIAEFAARGVAWNFKVLTQSLIVRVIPNTAANLLFVDGTLAAENAEDLALTYAKTIENYARYNLTADVTSKFKILHETFFNFMLSVDGNEDRIYPVATYYFANEWFVAALSCNWLNQ